MFVKDILIKNSYPNYIIKDLIRKSGNIEQGRTNKQIDISGNPQKYYSLSYIPKLTENKKLQEIIKDKQTIISHKANKTINSLFTRTKTKIDKNEQSNVVYEITCKGNNEEHCGQVYVGTTKRSLNTRISEHETDIKKKKLTTALAQHCMEKQHNADLINVKILDKERKENKRYTLESLRIQQRSTNAVNRKEDKDNINTNYMIAIF